MSKARAIIKFDGSAMSGKQMDVNHLTPSLLALSELIKETNKKINNENTAIRVYVSADLQQNCFELIVNVVQSAWDQTLSLISDPKIIKAKEIIEWLGILTGGGYGLYKLLKLLRNKKIKNVAKVTMKDGKYIFCITLIDENGDESKIEVPEITYKLYSDPKIRRNAIKVLAPLGEEGYDSLQFHDGEKVHEEFSKEDLPEFTECPEVHPENIQKSIIKTNVRIRKAVYEGSSKWTLVYKRAIEASIEDAEWLLKFQNNQEDAPPNSSLFVDLEEEWLVDENGEALEDPIYSVKKVHGVTKPPEQSSFDV